MVDGHGYIMANKKLLFVMLVHCAKQFKAHSSQFSLISTDWLHLYEFLRCLHDSTSTVVLNIKEDMLELDRKRHQLMLIDI